MSVLRNYFFKITIIIFAVFISGIVWYSPFLFKGYSPDAINDQLVLARNMTVSGKYSLYNDHGVLLASDMIAEKGEVSSIGNKFTAVLYSKVINFFGWQDTGGFLLISIILNALALLVFSFTALRLFGAKTALVFIFIYALLPTNWRTVYALGNYEFSLFFLSFFFLFFLLGRDKKYSYVYFIFAGTFLSGAVLAKEAFLMILPILFAHLFLKKKFKMLIYIFAPVVIIMSIFYLPSFLGGNNIYKSQLLTKVLDKQYDFSLAGHLYPDYYTFRFGREEFLKQYEQIEKGENGIIKSLNIKKAAANVGVKNIGLFERVIVGIHLFIAHVARFFSLEDIGGPFIFLLGFLGTVYLKKKDLFLQRFLIWWIGGSVLLFSFVAIAGRNHLVDFGWAIALLVALGVGYIFEMIGRNFDLIGRKKMIMGVLATIVLVYGLLVTDHVAWGRAYDGATLKTYAYADAIREKNIASQGVVATGIRHDENLTLNFLVDRSLVVFRPETMEKILAQGKGKEVFQEFNIKYILGYPDDLSQRIAKITGADIIATDKISYKFTESSPAKSLLMNLIR